MAAYGQASGSSGVDITYQWQEGVEDLEGYVPGGYHPVLLGDEFKQGRYRIVHKLGHGSYSTVWLARGRVGDRYVALKVVVAAASHTSTESKIMRALKLGNQGHLGRRFVTQYIDDFVVEGPNGRHRCIVSEPAGCSIAHSKEASITWKFPLRTARAIVAQVLTGLDYIHSCGIVHGDLHSNNILLQIPGLDCLSMDELYIRYGKPITLPVHRIDGRPNVPQAQVPQYCVQPAFLVTPSDEVIDGRIKVSDFGESYFIAQSNTRTELHSPILLLPPELFFHETLGKAADVWTMGCTLYEILGERPLFEGFMDDEDHAIAEMISTLGPLPRRWWDKWQKKGDFFDEDGLWKQDTHRAHAPYSRPLLDRMKIMGRGDEFLPEELVSLERLLRAMLAYEPTERITAEQALNSEWIQKWGLPALRDYI